MTIEEDEQSARLDYARPGIGDSAQRSNWPTALYLVALLWALITMTWFTIATTGDREDGRGPVRTEFALLLCATGRLVWARLRCERNKGWIFYVLLLFFAVPIWMLIAPPLGEFGMNFATRHWGEPLFP